MFLKWEEPSELVQTTGMDLYCDPVNEDTGL